MAADERRALEMLANSRAATETLLGTYGFFHQIIAGLVDKELTTATTERARAGDWTMKVTKVWITDAGRMALEG
jgi:hypothetical protein